MDQRFYIKIKGFSRKTIEIDFSFGYGSLKLEFEEKDIDVFIKAFPIKFLQRNVFHPSEAIYTIGDNTNDKEMIRDYNGFRIGNNKDFTPEGIYKYGKSACSGYSTLFSHIANSLGVESVCISGYAKGYEYSPGEIIEV